MDCGVRFSGDEYTNHKTCVSEAEKYQGSLYKAPSKQQGKKRNLQEHWMDVIKLTASNKDQHGLDDSTHEIILHISQFNNVPRKQSKFYNFLTSSIPSADKPLQIKAWKALEKAWREDKARQEASSSSQGQSHPCLNGSRKRPLPSTSSDTSPSAGKKAKTVEEAADTNRDVEGSVKSSICKDEEDSMSAGSDKKQKKKKKDSSDEGEEDGRKETVSQAGKWEEVAWRILRSKSKTSVKKLLKRLKKEGFKTSESSVKEFLLSLEGVIELKVGDSVVRVKL